MVVSSTGRQPAAVAVSLKAGGGKLGLLRQRCTRCDFSQEGADWIDASAALFTAPVVVQGSGGVLVPGQCHHVLQRRAAVERLGDRACAQACVHACGRLRLRGSVFDDPRDRLVGERDAVEPSAVVDGPQHRRGGVDGGRSVPGAAAGVRVGGVGVQLSPDGDRDGVGHGVGIVDVVAALRRGTRD